MIEGIKTYYRKDRLKEIDPDFLEYEEAMSSPEDLELIAKLLFSSKRQTIPNPHNSILLYITGITDDFIHTDGRSHTIGGSPPDIDIDFDAADRHKAIDWAIEHWGRENVANIGTIGSLKPKSLVRRWYKAAAKDPREMQAVLKMIPEAHYGKEATFEEILNGNESKGYAAHPELKQPRYTQFMGDVERLEGMAMQPGIHAGGLVISDFPIWDIVPLWTRAETGSKERRWVTQYDMHEVEELGLIKFDFLSIDNISIIKKCCQLLAETGIEVDPYAIPDGDRKTYKMLAQGLLAGIFQVETSSVPKKLIGKIKPDSINGISDIIALGRPGPMQMGSDKEYITNKAEGYPEEEMHPVISEILKDTYWTLIYQEQVMAICSRIGGFSMREADDVRRAMG